MVCRVCELGFFTHRSALLPFLRIEQLQAFFLVADDVMDSSVTRRGQPCWYKKPEVGLIAINDSFLLEAAIYHLIKNHFRKEDYYIDLVELFHETSHQTEVGQLIDLVTAPEDHVDLSKFNLTKCVKPRGLRHRLTCMQASTDRGLQNGFLFVLPSSGFGHAYCQNSRFIPEPGSSQ